MASTLGLSPILGILFAPIFVGTIGMLVERVLIKPLYSRPMDTLLVTWGLSIVLKQVIQLLFGAGHKNVEALFVGSMDIFGVKYPIYRMFIIVITLVLLALVFFIYYKTSFGLKMRMVIQNRSQAMAMGINTASVDRWTFALGSALAGIAGAIMTPLMFISPEMGGSYLTNSFIVVIIGGVSSLIGLVGGGMVIGFSRSSIDFIIASSFWTNIIVLLLAIVVIRFKPNGIFSRKSG
jgi:urea transport system permease protein